MPCLRFLSLALVLWALQVAGVRAAPAEPLSMAKRPRYKLFPEAVSPDGQWCLAWGEKLPEGADLASLLEVPYAERLNPAEVAGVQDYLVPTQRPKGQATAGAVLAPLALPKTEYFSDGDGHEDKHGLTFAWSPQSDAVCVLYEGEKSVVAASYLDLKTRQVSEVAIALETAVRLLVREKFGPEVAKKCTGAQLARLGVPEAGVLAVDATIYDSLAPEGSEVSYGYRMRLRVEPWGEGVRLQPLQSRLLWKEDYEADVFLLPDEKLEEELAKAYRKLSTALAPAAREALKQEQLRWQKQRGGLASEAHRAGFTRHRVEELAIRADE